MSCLAEITHKHSVPSQYNYPFPNLADTHGMNMPAKFNNPVNPQHFPAPFGEEVSSPAPQDLVLLDEGGHVIGRSEMGHRSLFTYGQAPDTHTGWIPWCGQLVQIVGTAQACQHHKRAIGRVLNVVKDDSAVSGLCVVIAFEAPYNNMPNEAFDYDHICQYENWYFLHDIGNHYFQLRSTNRPTYSEEDIQQFNLDGKSYPSYYYSVLAIQHKNKKEREKEKEREIAKEWLKDAVSASILTYSMTLLGMSTL